MSNAYRLEEREFILHSCNQQYYVTGMQPLILFQKSIIIEVKDSIF